MVLSICEWGDNQPWVWAKDIGHLWRITGDIGPIFDGEEGHGSWSSWGVLQILDMRTGIRQYGGPDHWNDFDMLEVGNGMSFEEDRAHFSLWCMMASPLMAGNDLRQMSEQTRAILTNQEAIAINQDSLGIQGFKCFQKDRWEVWAKPLKNGELALCFLNRTQETITAVYDWNDIKWIKDDQLGFSYGFVQNVYSIRDIWAENDAGTTAKPFKAVLKPHDVVMLRLKKK